MKWGALFVALVVALVLLPGPGAPGPFDTHEARDLEVARELIEQREPITPTLGYERLFEKPLAAYAPDVLVQLAFPRAPVAASRVWRALAAVLLVLVTAATTARHLGARAGVCAAAVLATTAAFPLAVLTDGTAVLAALFAWTAIDGFTHAWFGGRSGAGPRLVIAYGALACAAVVCGPLAALWPFAAAAIYQALTRRPGAWRALRPGAGLLMVIGLALPWYGAAFERHRAAFAVHAIAFPYGASPPGPWYAGPLLVISFVVVGCFPWSALLPGALRHAAAWWTPRDASGTPQPGPAPVVRELGHEHAAHWFLACAIGALLPLLVTPRAPLSAVLPALPALAALCGRLLDHLIEDQQRAGPGVFLGAQMLSLMGTVGSLMLMLVAGRMGTAAPAVRVLATVVFATCWLPMLAALTGRLRLAALLMLGPVALGVPLAVGYVVPAAEGYVTSRTVADAIVRTMPDRAPLVLFDDPPPSLRWLVRRDFVQAAWYPGPLAAPHASDGCVYLAWRPAREATVRAAIARQRPGAAIEVLADTPGLVLGRVRVAAAG